MVNNYTCNHSAMIDFIDKELKLMLNDIVIKLDYIAKKYETIEIKRDADVFVSSVEGLDTFETHLSYSKEILEDAGVPYEILEGCIYNKNLIPYKYRDKALKLKRKEIILNYEEKNNYYRMLNGLPDCNDKDFIYINEDVSEVDTLKPIHMMSEEEIYKLKYVGILNKLKEKYPEKKYLFHLENRISFAYARKMKNYGILYIPKSVTNPGITNVFTALYNDSIYYVNNTVYDKAFSATSQFYDSFIGLFILCITIQRFVSSGYLNGIKRDFFDKDLIKDLFDSFGIPFYSEISLNYLKKIAKNLNKLLYYKATNKVFIDIFDLFGLSNAKMTEYYLMKTRQTDENDEPLFFYKEKEHSDGTKEIVEDVEKMYSLKFIEVPNDTKNLALELMDKSNYIDYDEVVDDDPLWGDDEQKQEIYKSILEKEFNFAETKYIVLNSSYELSKLNFELCYLFRMLIDLKEKEKFLYVPVPLMGKQNLFDVIVALFALLSQKLGLEGKLIDTTTKTMSVYGFNFSKDMKYINNVYKRYLEETGVDIKDIVISGPESHFKDQKEFLNLFLHDGDVYQNLLKMKYETQNIKEYNAYKRIFDSTMITKYGTDMYRSKQDNSLPESYLDYLYVNNIRLYEYVDDTDDENIVEQMDLLLSSLDNYFDSDEFENVFINIPQLSIDNIKKFIYYLIMVFKSYTVDLAAMNIVYHVDNKRIHNIKMITEMYIKAKDTFKDNLGIDFFDEEIFSAIEQILEKPMLNTEWIKGIVNDQRIDKFNYKEVITSKAIETLKDNLGIDFFDEEIFNILNEMIDKSGILSNDYYKFIVSIQNNDKLLITDNGIMLASEILKDNLGINFNDYTDTEAFNKIKEKFKFVDNYNFEVLFGFRDKINIKDIYELLLNDKLKDKLGLDFNDEININSFISTKEKLFNNDKINLLTYLQNNDKIKIKDLIISDLRMEMKDTMRLNFSDSIAKTISNLLINGTNAVLKNDKYLLLSYMKEFDKYLIQDSMNSTINKCGISSLNYFYSDIIDDENINLEHHNKMKIKDELIFY